MKIKYLVFIVSLIFASCQEKTYYENNGASCKLTLYKDGTYKYITPWVFRTYKEFGKYKIHKDTLFLESKNFNNKDSILNIEYFCSNDTPSFLKLITTNFDNKKISTKIKLNNTNTIITTNSYGEYDINYKELEENGVIEKGKSISYFTVTFNGIDYKMDMEKDYLNSRKPEKLVFKLNDFAGQEFRPLIRRYLITNDTIITNDISRKLTGFSNYKLLKK